MDAKPGDATVWMEDANQHRFILSKRINHIGRLPSNDVVLPTPDVSKGHAVIYELTGSYYIQDLGSTNGTFVNGKRIVSETRITDGDIIRIGDDFTFHCPSKKTVLSDDALSKTRPHAIIRPTQPSGPKPGGDTKFYTREDIKHALDSETTKGDGDGDTKIPPDETENNKKDPPA